MSTIPRPPAIHHCTSEPLRFFGRAAELAQLDLALRDSSVSVVGLVGLGGQGKTAVVQHWLQQLPASADRPDGLFFWSFYRGKDADLCLRELHAYAEQLCQSADVAASYCVDRLLPILRRERWVIVFDGTEVVQHESGAWLGRFAHPELGRFVEELAGEPMPGVLVLTMRFPLPTLLSRCHARLIDLTALDAASARGLLRGLGVRGTDAALDEAAAAMSLHAKGVELLGTWLVQFADGDVAALSGVARRDRRCCQRGGTWRGPRVGGVSGRAAGGDARHPGPGDGISAAAGGKTTARLSCQRACEVAAHQNVAPRLPTTGSVRRRMACPPSTMAGGFASAGTSRRRGTSSDRRSSAGAPWLREYAWPGGTPAQRDDPRRFLARPARSPSSGNAGRNPRGMRAFSCLLRRRPLERSRQHPGGTGQSKAPLPVPAFERDLLLRFFPSGDWRQPPLWTGFGRWRSLAICLEMLGQFADALEVYRPADAALGGDALIALGKLEPLLTKETMPQPWQNLWRAYRAHALCLAGRTKEAVALARSLIPIDIYEWVHVFECLLCGGVGTSGLQ